MQLLVPREQSQRQPIKRTRPKKRKNVGRERNERKGERERDREIETNRERKRARERKRERERERGREGASCNKARGAQKDKGRSSNAPPRLVQTSLPISQIGGWMPRRRETAVNLSNLNAKPLRFLMADKSVSPRSRNLTASCGKRTRQRKNGQRKKQ